MLQVSLLCLLSVVVLVSRGLPLTVQRLLRVYGAYVFVAFTMRSLGLLIFQPAPGSGSFAVQDLIAPTYEAGLSQVLMPVNLGLATLVLTVYAASRVLRWSCSDSRPLSVGLWTIVGAYLAGNLLRAAAIFVPSVLGNVASRGSLIAPAVLALLVIGTDWRGDKSARQFLIIACCVELGWAFMLASKTPILAVIVILYVDPRRTRVSLKSLVAAIAGIIVAFSLVQNLKPSSVDSEVPGGSVSASFFASGVANRFDGLRAATESVGHGARSYLTPVQFSETLISGLVPQTFSETQKVPAGLRWGQEIYHVQNGTYYAEGLSAEGYVVAGLIGVILWNVVGGMVLVGLASGLNSSNLPFRLISSAFVASSALFERGLLGQAEQLNVAMQGCLVILVIFVLSARRPVDTSPLRA